MPPTVALILQQEVYFAIACWQRIGIIELTLHHHRRVYDSSKRQLV